jgi:hypothetical protein
MGDKNTLLVQYRQLSRLDRKWARPFGQDVLISVAKERHLYYRDQLEWQENHLDWRYH